MCAQPVLVTCCPWAGALWDYSFDSETTLLNMDELLTRGLYPSQSLLKLFIL